MNTNKMHEKAKIALLEYREKIKNGEIEAPERLDPLERAKANPQSRALAVKAYCYDCCGGSSNEVKLCPSTNCPLWNFR